MLTITLKAAPLRLNRILLSRSHGCALGYQRYALRASKARMRTPVFVLEIAQSMVVTVRTARLGR
jgi:hypothetical protein